MYSIMGVTTKINLMLTLLESTYTELYFGSSAFTIIFFVKEMGVDTFQNIVVSLIVPKLSIAIKQDITDKAEV